MARGAEGAGTAASQRGSKKTPEGMREVRRFSGKREQKSAEQQDERGGMEGREGDVSYAPRILAVEKLNSVVEKLNTRKRDYYSLMDGLQLTQKELERVRGDL